MSAVAWMAKRIGLGGIFMLVVAGISGLLGFMGDSDIIDIAKTFIITHWRFFSGVFIGLALAGITRNWYLGVIVAVITIFVLYTVV